MIKTEQLVHKAELLRLAGHSYRAIGQQLGVSNGTIQRWLNPEYDDKLRQTRRENYRLNSEPQKLASQRYYASNKVAHLQYNLEYKRRRRKVDVQFRISESLRNRLYQFVNQSDKAGSAVSDLGCSIEKLKQHLEDQFQPGMTWQNHGQWHIDHIKPLASFNLEDREQFLEACHYTNLQPLWAEENLRKGATCHL